MFAVASLLLLAPRCTLASPVVRVVDRPTGILDEFVLDKEERTKPTADGIIDNRLNTGTVIGRRLASTVCPTSCASLARAWWH